MKAWRGVVVGPKVIYILTKLNFKSTKTNKNHLLLGQKVYLPSFNSIQHHLAKLQNAKKEPPAGLEPAANRLRAEHSTD